MLPARLLVVLYVVAGMLISGSASAALLSDNSGFASPDVYTFDGGGGTFDSQTFANLTGSLPDAELEIASPLGADVDVLNSTNNSLFFDNLSSLGNSGPAYGSVGVPDPNTSGQIEIIIDSALQIVKAGIFMSNADVENTTFTVDALNGTEITSDNEITVATKGDGAFIGWDNGTTAIESLKIGWDNDFLIAFDDLTIQEIPEPGALALALAGVGLMLVRRRG